MKTVFLFLVTMCLSSVAFAAVPKAETFKLGKSEKKVELVQLQGSAGCEVLYQGQKVGWGQANPGKCESIYNQISANLIRGGYAAAPAAPSVEAPKKDMDKTDAEKPLPSKDPSSGKGTGAVVDAGQKKA